MIQKVFYRGQSVVSKEMASQKPQVRDNLCEVFKELRATRKAGSKEMQRHGQEPH